MNDARAAPSISRELGTKSDEFTGDCAGLFARHAAWLATLKKGDAVTIRNGKGHFHGEVTDATPCFVFTGKLKFRRDNGWQTRRQWRYRLRLRLVRNAEELQ